MSKSLGQALYEALTREAVGAPAYDWDSLPDTMRAHYVAGADAVVAAYLASQAEALNTKPNDPYWLPTAMRDIAVVRSERLVPMDTKWPSLPADFPSDTDREGWKRLQHQAEANADENGKDIDE